MTRSADHYFAIIPENILYADISHIAVRVYGVLRRHADKDNGTCHPGRSRIAKVAHTSPSSVDRAISELVRIGAIEVIHRPDPDNPKHLLSNQYRLLTPPAHDDTPPAGDDTPLPPVTIPPTASDEVTIVKELESENESVSQLCELLADSIHQRGHPRPTITKAWMTDMERLIRIDGKTPAQIETVIKWLDAGNDKPSQFWQPNIRSPKKLREKWGQMADQYKREHPQPKKELRPYDQPTHRGCDNCDHTGYISHQDQQDRWYSTPCPDCQ